MSLCAADCKFISALPSSKGGGASYINPKELFSLKFGLLSGLRTVLVWWTLIQVEKKTFVLFQWISLDCFEVFWEPCLTLNSNEKDDSIQPGHDAEQTLVPLWRWQCPEEKTLTWESILVVLSPDGRVQRMPRESWLDGFVRADWMGGILPGFS